MNRTFEIPKSKMRQVANLAHRSGADSVDELVGWALAVYEDALNHVSDGKEIIIMDSGNKTVAGNLRLRPPGKLWDE